MVVKITKTTTAVSVFRDSVSHVHCTFHSPWLRNHSHNPQAEIPVLTPGNPNASGVGYSRCLELCLLYIIAKQGDIIRANASIHLQSARYGQISFSHLLLWVHQLPALGVTTIPCRTASHWAINTASHIIYVFIYIQILDVDKPPHSWPEKKTLQPWAPVHKRNHLCSYCTAQHNIEWQAKFLKPHHRWESGSIEECCVIYPSPCSISVTELEIETSPINDTTSRGMTGASWSPVPKHV